MKVIDPELPGFWEALAEIGTCRYRFDFPTCRFVGDLELGSSQIIDGDLHIPEGGLFLQTRSFQDVFFNPGEAILEMISRRRRLKVSFRPMSEEGTRHMRLLARVFGDTEDEGELPMPVLEVPCLCPSCGEAAEARIRDLPINPLTGILAVASMEGRPVMVAAHASEGGVTLNHQPGDLLRDHDRLISEGGDSGVSFNIRHLHALKLAVENLDGEMHQSLALINSLGETTCRIYSDDIRDRDRWRDILSRPGHSYRVVEE